MWNHSNEHNVLSDSLEQASVPACEVLLSGLQDHASIVLIIYHFEYKY
jgi:hypothetical protein